MLDPLQRLLARTGKTESDFKKNSKLGLMFRKRGVANSRDLRRVLDLPRYRWQEDHDLEALRVELTKLYAQDPRECERSCACAGKGSMELRAVQAAALAAIHDNKGSLNPMRVGSGKTLVTYLAGRVCNTKTLLLVPAKLARKTRHEFAKLSRHWKETPNLKIMSYELLSRDRGLKELIEHRPELLICDEAHKLKNTKAACTRRVRRYLKENPECRYVDLSGTSTKRSLKELHHRLLWALGDEHAPLPTAYSEINDWADALDAEVKLGQRLAPGALLQMCSESELDDIAKDSTKALAHVRSGFRRRLTETPGVIATEEMFDGAMSILLTAKDFEPSDEVRKAFAHLRSSWQTPDGDEIESAVSLWRHARELACGFYYEWDPPPPSEWLQVRQEWHRFVRETLRHARNIDTEMQVARLCAREDLSQHAYLPWMNIKDTFKPNTKPVWICDRALKFCRDWMLENEGIVWTEHVAFGERLAELAKHSYYGRGGLDSYGSFIEEAQGPIIASISANFEGRNLQYTYDKNLIVTVPSGGNIWEQLIGRTHRDGQSADEVTVDVLINCHEQWSCYKKARADAEYAQKVLGQPQKLLYADEIDFPTEKTIEEKTTDPLWDPKSASFFVDKKRQDD